MSSKGAIPDIGIDIGIGISIGSGIDIGIGVESRHHHLGWLGEDVARSNSPETVPGGKRIPRENDNDRCILIYNAAKKAEIAMQGFQMTLH
jgi:hypothetical protein